MRNTIVILTILTVLAGAAVCRADHVLDQASQTLAEGDAGRAVELYRQANAELPTAEGYNNLGIALERSRHFADAADAYRESLRLPEPAGQTEINLRRARVRALIQAGLPVAASVFGGILSFFAFIWLAKRLTRAWRAWLFRMRFRGVRANMIHHVQCRDGQYQPDGKAYPDSESISFKADLNLPQRGDIYPLQLEMEVVSPDGAIWKMLRETVDTAETERMTVWFQADEIGELLTRSGIWKARLVLQNINKGLATDRFTVVTRADLVADLQTVDASLIALRGSRAEPESVIFPDVEALVPTAVIRPRCCHPSKFVGMRLRLDLVNVERPNEVESQEYPLELIDGAVEFCTVNRPVAGDELARKLGRWEFRLSVEGRQLARMPFVITSVEQVLEGLKVECFEIAEITRSGRTASVGRVAYVRNLRALCPVVTVTSKLPMPRAGLPMTIGVCVNDEPVGGVEGMLVMDRHSVELVPGEFTPPGIPEGRGSTRISFIFMVERRTLGIREVTLRLKPPRCADAQGRITAPPSAGEIDYDDEAARILGEARVGG